MGTVWVMKHTSAVFFLMVLSLLYGSPPIVSAQDKDCSRSLSPPNPPQSTDQGSKPPETPALLQDPSWIVGSTLQSIITQFGSPLAVYTVRGQEPWQDDVVFSYDGIDLYWYQNRVWQIAVPQGYGIKKGDTRDTVFATLGDPLIQEDAFLVYRLPSKGWPLRLRIHLSDQDRVSGLYVYRPDF